VRKRGKREMQEKKSQKRGKVEWQEGEERENRGQARGQNIKT
jgi:hypothetical protein